MWRRIFSVFMLVLLTTGMTIYGYRYDAQTASVLAQADALPAATASDGGDTDPIDTAANLPALSDSQASKENNAAEESVDRTDALLESAKASDALPAAGGTDAENTDPALSGSQASKENNAAEESADSPAVDMTKVTVFPEPKTMYVRSLVNVRKGPDTSYDRIGSVNQNEALTILGQYENDGWYHFIYHGEDAFVSCLYVAETMPEPAEQAQPEEAVPPAQTEQPEPAPAPESAPALEPAPQPAAAAGVLFIGDSRCVQMKEAVEGGGCTWICENAKGYSWLIDTALARADSVVGKGTKVVMCLGVNDTRNCDSYAAIMNQKAAEWAAKGAKTYFVSVNPVWENPYTSEEQVENFNASIVGQLNGITWIDTHSWLTTNGYRLVDGLHYDTNTYINIFHVITGSL